MDNQQQLQDLLSRLDKLNGQQTSLQNTIQELRQEVTALAQKLNNDAINKDSIVAITSVEEIVEKPVAQSLILPFTEVKIEETSIEEVVETPMAQSVVWEFPAVKNKEPRTLETFLEDNFDTTTANSDTTQQEIPPQYEPPFEVKQSLEAFIGENLASKVGILITVLGVSIGVKYAIDHNLISPWGRIILGYLAGCGLMEASFRLRRKEEKYEDLSNIILGGGLASVFFVTYAAYSFYGLMPQAVAFGLMVFITGLTVAAAMKYEQQIIAIGGLLGAYSIPFLLSTGEDKPITLFTYMAIINVGILYISFKRNWQMLYHLAFVITWMIFMKWISSFNNYQRTTIAGTYLSLFFAGFYTMFLAQKFFKNTADKSESTLQNIILFINSTLFYGIGYVILNANSTGEHFLGAFTIFNALLHLGISKVVYDRNLNDRSLFSILSRFAVFFITLAISVQFEGTTVTLLLTAEMVILYLIGRNKNLSVYESSSFPLWALITFSLAQDWVDGGYFNNFPSLKSELNTPIFNAYLLTTIVVISAFIFILINLHKGEKNTINSEENKGNLFYFLSNLVVGFTTIAIIILFDGVVVTFLLAAEMAFLFWINHTRKLPIYGISAHPLWVLTLFSLFNDWSSGGYPNPYYGSEYIPISLIFNVYSFISIIVIGAFIFVRYIHGKDMEIIKNIPENISEKKTIDVTNVILNTVVLGLIYLLFYNEIHNYFTHLDKASAALFKDIRDNNLSRFRIIWGINYTLLFVGVLNFINLKKYQNFTFAKVTGVLGLLAVFIFLSSGLYTLGTVKNAYLYREQAEYFQRGIFGGLLLRYVSFTLVIGLMYVLNQSKNLFFKDNQDVQKTFDIAVSVTLLWVMSSEMVHWLELSGYTQTYKWAISVLFGIFALGLVSYGISKKKKHLRIAAIVLFVLTLIKLFAFDLMGLDTIAKTIVLVSLGLLLLTISYVYTKFKDTLLGED
jgi:hypothetical protein